MILQGFLFSNTLKFDTERILNVLKESKTTMSENKLLKLFQRKINNLKKVGLQQLKTRYRKGWNRLLTEIEDEEEKELKYFASIYSQSDELCAELMNVLRTADENTNIKRELEERMLFRVAEVRKMAGDRELNDFEACLLLAPYDYIMEAYKEVFDEQQKNG